jgi:hypothetical protein
MSTIVPITNVSQAAEATGINFSSNGATNHPEIEVEDEVLFVAPRAEHEDDPPEHSSDALGPEVDGSTGDSPASTSFSSSRANSPHAGSAPASPITHSPHVDEP